MKVLLKSPLGPHSGYGNDGIGLALAMIQAGFDVYLDPASVQSPLPPQVAELLTKRLKPPFDLLLHHTDPQQLGITSGARASAEVTVAHTMWEMSTLDNCKGRSTLRRRLSDYDLVVGYDSVSAGALRPYVTNESATIQGGYWPQQWPAKARNFRAKTLKFCMVGALGARKDPMTAIMAFQELRDEHPELDIELNIKTVSPGLHSSMQSWAPGLRIFYEVWPEEVLRDFYYDQHVLIAPSRGEGKNMPALEFMSTGGTVIATNWGGHTQWLSPSFGYPLVYSLGPVSPATPECLWAKADKEHLKHLMLDCATNRDEVQRRATLASRLIPDMCAWPKVIDRLITTIGAMSEAGERVAHTARRAQERTREKASLW